MCQILPNLMFGSVCKVRVVTLMQRDTTEEYKILRRDIKSEQVLRLIISAYYQR
jgi:hypothetical protein